MNVLNQRDQRGLWANVGLAIATVVVLNGLIFGLGWDQSGSAEVQPSFAPPGWVIGGIWIVLFGLMGAARWLLARRRDRMGTRGGWFVVALMVACLIYPFYTSTPDSTRVGLIGNILTLVVAVVAIWNVARISSRATALMLPVAAWLSFAIFLTVRILQLNA